LGFEKRTIVFRADLVFIAPPKNTHTHTAWQLCSIRGSSQAGISLKAQNMDPYKRFKDYGLIILSLINNKETKKRPRKGQICCH